MFTNLFQLNSPDIKELIQQEATRVLKQVPCKKPQP